MAKVSLRKIKKVYDNGFQAVAESDIEIKDKEFLVLVGPSGCGKSTTLRMIAGLEEITDGELFIGDNLVNDLDPKDRDIAMVFQNYALYPHMSVYDNMAFGLKIRKFPKDEIERRVSEAAKILHIESHLNKKPSRLSGGERQRVAMGRAIVRKPQAFLFDEPLSNLDAKLRVTMRAEISKIHLQLRTTIVYVTHDQVEAMTLADRMVVMKGGYIQQIGAPLDVYNNPRNKFVAGFIGTPPMNFFKVEIKKSGSKISAEHGECKFTLNDTQQKVLANYVGKELTFGVRPEDITISADRKNTIKAKVDVIEPLGSDINSYLTTNDGAQIISKIDSKYNLELEKEIELGINIDNCNFFAPANSNLDPDNKNYEKCII